MQYFDSLPKVIYTDQYGVRTIRTNLMARAGVIPELLKSPLLYYSYDIQEGDTPEIIAHKYYNDMYRYWIVLFANQLLDPQWNWPLTYSMFQAYMIDKYTAEAAAHGWTDPLAYTQSTIHHYEKIISQYEDGTQTTTSNTITIDLDTYNNIPVTPTVTTFSFPLGNVTITVSRNAVTIYDYENGVNEGKRSIQILNNQYVDQMETEFKKLMG